MILNQMEKDKILTRAEILSMRLRISAALEGFSQATDLKPTGYMAIGLAALFELMLKEKRTKLSKPID